MRKLEYEINAGLGDNLIIRTFFDTIKHNYDQIIISHSKTVMSIWRNNDPAYFKFLNDIGNLLFSEPPYIFDHNNHATFDPVVIARDFKIQPKKPNIDHLLCKGTPLNLNEEYIVITTKIRLISNKVFLPLSIQLWNTLNRLSKKYKIVILGEREIEKSKEYSHSNNIGVIFSIYEQIIANISSDRIIDLTVPALGITAPDLIKIQQDCLIMNKAKFVITFGIGGNLWLASAISNTIGFRAEPITTDQATINFYGITDLLSNPLFTTSFFTKDWNLFLKKLEET